MDLLYFFNFFTVPTITFGCSIAFFVISHGPSKHPNVSMFSPKENLRTPESNS
jgi:hypothetical protein